MNINLREIIKNTCKDLLVKDYCDFSYFLELLYNKVDYIYELHNIEDLNCYYNKNNKMMYISFLINDKGERGERIDLSSLRGYSSSRSSVDEKVARKNKYYCNFQLKLDEINETIMKMKNYDKSNKRIEKFSL